ncbi:MAG: metallophosphoesterase family protein [Candidatus Hydrothermarchaeales archaeon]
MKIAVLSDIHSNMPALKEVLKGIDGMEIFCCGDLVGYNPFPNEVVELFRKKHIHCILGNHDQAVITGDTSWFNPIAARAIEWTIEALKDENLEFLKTLPRVYEDGFYAVHGSPRNQLEEYVYPDYPLEVLLSFFDSTEKNVMALGHTHTPFQKRLDDKLLFNPGSVGQPRDLDPCAAYAILDLDINDVEIRRVEYDIDEVADAIIERGLPTALAQRLHLGW